jgi:hypothetical protein
MWRQWVVAVEDEGNLGRWAVSALRCVADAVRIVASATLVLWMSADSAAAASSDFDRSEASRALTEGNAALAAAPTPPDARRLLERVVTGGADPLTVAEAHFRLGVLDEDSRAFAAALVNYRACVASMPTSRWARNARQRITWLAERSEGDFKPLVRLQLVNRDPSLTNDPAAIDALAAAAETFPEGIVRGDARMLVAETWLRRMNRREDAVRELRKVLDDPWSDRLSATFAERDLVGVWLDDGRLDEAVKELHRYHFDSQSQTTVRELLHRRTLRRSAVLAAVVLVGGVIFILMRRRRQKLDGPNRSKVGRQAEA